MTELALLSVFLVGLLSGPHCAGMCGGIVSALSMQQAAPRWGNLAAYNAGRVASYTLAGMAAGAVGGGWLLLEGILPAQQALYMVANLLLVALGLYLAGIWYGITYLERIGALAWKRIQPYGQRLMPVRTPAQALLLGSLWGWLPCGLVYSLLAAALASGSAVNGAALMLAFGLGTVPNLLALGYFAGRIKPFLQRRAMRLAAGLLVAGFGVLGLARAGDPAGALWCSIPAGL